MKDVQGEKDLRCVPLKHVGIKDLRWPIELRDKTKGTQHTVAKVTLAVDLPHDMRGTHMSRLSKPINYSKPRAISLANFVRRVLMWR